MSVVSSAPELHLLAFWGIFALSVAIVAFLALPRPLRQRSLARGYREDGSFSRRRESIEKRNRLKFVLDVAVATTLLGLPILASVFLIHQWVMSDDVATTAMGRFGHSVERSSDTIGSELAVDIRSESTPWASTAGDSGAGARNAQANIWQAWPVLLGSMLLLSLLGVRMLMRSIRQLVDEFMQALIRREFEYDKADWCAANFMREDSALLDMEIPVTDAYSEQGSAFPTTT